MKICAIICEFNPFHNGHKYVIEQAKAISGCDSVLCIMSGSFTQRGDVAILDKFKRAEHAVKCGADCVIELPVAFSVAPAEIFAKGAVKILSSIPEVSYLAFGCENLKDYISIAKDLLREDDKFIAILKENLDKGTSYIKSYETACKELSLDTPTSPNDILALEYAKAVLQYKPDVELIPIKRMGANFNDDNVYENFSSASAIRANLKDSNVLNNVPDNIRADLANAKLCDEQFGTALKCALINSNHDELKKIFGCNEGLENKLLDLSCEKHEEILGKTVSKRYSRSRIKRILLANALHLYEAEQKSFLQGDLYIKPLAINGAKKDEILSSLQKSLFPTVIRMRDTEKLSNCAQLCFERDIFATKLWNVITNENVYDFTIKTV